MMALQPANIPSRSLKVNLIAKRNHKLSGRLARELDSTSIAVPNLRDSFIASNPAKPEKLFSSCKVRIIRLQNTEYIILYANLF